MRQIAAALMVAGILAAAESPDTVHFHHLYTFGSKAGIHPPKVLNRRLATAAMGTGDHPYGLGYPVGVATDLHHRVWITDSGTNSVHVFDRSGAGYREIRRVGDVVLQQPAGIAVDAQGRVYVVDSAIGTVFVFDEQGEYDRALVKRGERLLEHPGAIALSADGRTIYVADPPRNVIVELDREGEVNGIISLPPELSDPGPISVVGNQIYVLGQAQHKVGNFSPDGQLRGEARWDGIQSPSAFVWDAARERFLVANPRWMVVRIFNAAGRDVGAFGQIGEGVDQMQRIDAVHVDPEGLVFVVDSHNGKVLVFAEDSGGVE